MLCDVSWNAPFGANAFASYSLGGVEEDIHCVMLHPQESLAQQPTTESPDGDNTLINRLRVLSQYGPSWDGERALPPRERAIQEAVAFARTIQDGDAMQASLESDGSVDISAQRDHVRVTMVFEGDGLINTYVRGRDLGFQHFVQELPWPLSSIGEFHAPIAML
jgi:hypothetical protein